MLWYQNKQSVVSTNQSVVLVLTAQPFENSFQPFLKTPKYKKSVVSTKQSVVFHLF